VICHEQEEIDGKLGKYDQSAQSRKHKVDLTKAQTSKGPSTQHIRGPNHQGGSPGRSSNRPEEGNG